MELTGKVIVVTGGGRGIGAALCRRFAAERPAGIVVCDLDGEAAREVARDVDGVAVEADVSREEAIRRLVAEAERSFGPVDLFCSNAGIGGLQGGIEAPDAEWHRMWEVNVVSHVYAARAVVPGMLERGEGYLLNTASAAGLLTQIGNAPYSVTKHAAVGLAEWLAITYGNRGIRVSCLCPLYVRTDMIAPLLELPGAEALLKDTIDPEQCAEATLEGIRDERFLILSHPIAGEYFGRKGSDYERWLRGMRRLQAGFDAAAGG